MIVLLGAVCAVNGAYAQLPGAKLNFVFPPGAQSGSSLEITVDGADLNGAQGLEFSHAGIRGEPVMSAGDGLADRPQWQRNRFAVTIAPEVPPGVYQVWFRGRYGISNARPFVVSDLPQAAEAGGNETRENAAEIALNSVVVGRIDAGKLDCFKIALEPGRKVVFDCRARRLGSRLDAQLAIYDAAGKQLARRRGAGDRDPVIVFDPPERGIYFVELSDFLSAGGADRLFRLLVSDRPYIESIFPPAGVPGSTSKFRITGANLPGDGDWMEVEIALPAERPATVEELPLHPREISSAGMIYRFQNSNPVPIAFASAPVVVEDPDAAEQQVLPPCEIAGNLVSPDQSDVFRFDAAKGEDWIIEGISHRAGHASDLHLTVSRVVIDAEGKRSEQKVAEADDDGSNIGGRRAPTASRDPILAFSAPEDGTYLVKLIDQFQLDDPLASYRLAIRRPVPDFALFAEIENPMTDGKRLENWSPSLLRGGRLQLEVKALRRDGFSDEILLRLEGAPAGVEIQAGKIEKGSNSGSITVSGAADLADWSGSLTVIGKAGDIEREAFGLALVNEVADFDNEVVVPQLGGPLLLAARGNAAPVSVSAEVPAVIETSIGGTIEIPLKFVREGAFKGSAKFYLAGIPNVAKPDGIDLDLNNAEVGKLTVPLKPSNENKYVPGRYEVFARGDLVLQFHPDPAGVLEAAEGQGAAETLVAEAAEALKLAEAKRGEIEQAGLTEEEKSKQAAAADEAIRLAKDHQQAAEQAKARAAELVKQADARNAPRDLRLAAFSNPFVIDIAAAPLRLNDLAPEIQVAKGGAAELLVGFERLFGFAEGVELSLLPPNDVKGFESAPIPVAKDQSQGQMTLRATPDASEGEHAFTVLAKATFNGVGCELRQPLKVTVTTPATPEQNP